MDSVVIEKTDDDIHLKMEGDKITFSLSIKVILQLEANSVKFNIPHLTIFNEKVKPNWIGRVSSPRAEATIYRLCKRISRENKKLRGSKKYKTEKKHSIILQNSELENVDVLQKSNEENVTKLNIAQEKLVRLIKLCHKMEGERIHHEKTMKLHMNLWTKHEEKIKENNVLTEETNNLREIIYNLGFDPQKEGKLPFKNYGKKISELSQRHGKRILHRLSGNIIDALWFLESYGLDIVSIKVKDSKERIYSVNALEKKVKIHTKKFTDLATNYHTLTWPQKYGINQLTLLLDTHCASSALWNELGSSETVKVPKLSLINQCRQLFDRQTNINKTPGNYYGAAISVIEDLQRVFANRTDVSSITIKIEGDGANMGRNAAFTSLHYAVLKINEQPSNMKDHRTIGIVKAPESYEAISEAFSEVFAEVNSLLKKKIIMLNDQEIPIKILFGADMKFILAVMGMKSASSDYSCIYCKIRKDQRCDTSIKFDYLNSIEMKRTLKSLKEDAACKTYGCHKYPLLEIEPDCVICDVLHARLRIFDRLIDNLILEAKERGTEHADKSYYLKELCKAIHECNIRFNVWQTAQGGTDHTDLTGREVLHLMNELPEKLETMDILYQETKEKVIFLWTEFQSLLQQMSKGTASSTIEQQCNHWLQEFVNLGAVRKGYYGEIGITPYMHIFVYHMPDLFRRFGALSQFSSQVCEKKNDIMKGIYLRHTNRWDPANQCLQILKRIELLSNFKRMKRRYVKQDEAYWNEGGIITSRKSRVHEKNRDVVPVKRARVETSTVSQLQPKKKRKFKKSEKDIDEP